MKKLSRASAVGIMGGAMIAVILGLGGLYMWQKQVKKPAALRNVDSGSRIHFPEEGNGAGESGNDADAFAEDPGLGALSGDDDAGMLPADDGEIGADGGEGKGVHPPLEPQVSRTNAGAAGPDEESRAKEGEAEGKHDGADGSPPVADTGAGASPSCAVEGGRAAMEDFARELGLIKDGLDDLRKAMKDVSGKLAALESSVKARRTAKTAARARTRGAGKPRVDRSAGRLAGWSLVGISGDSAIIERQKDKETFLVERGSKVSGFTVLSIDQGGDVVKTSKGRITADPRRDRPKGPQG